MTGGLILTGQFPKTLQEGVLSFGQLDYDERERIYPKLFDSIQSKKAYEESVSGTSFTVPTVKLEGGKMDYQNERQLYTTRLKPVVWALGFGISWEAMEDNLYPELSRKRMKRLMRAFVEGREIVLHNYYNNGFTASTMGNESTGDGSFLIASDHATPSGTQSNLLTAADWSNTLAKDFFINIQKAKNNQGQYIKLRPKSIIIPPDLEFEVNETLKSTLLAGTANNNINSIRMAYGNIEIIVTPYLTDADAVFMRTNLDSDDGLVITERSALKTDSDYDKGTLTQKFFGVERYGFGCFDWRAIWGCRGV